MTKTEKLPFGLWLMHICCNFTTHKKRLFLNQTSILLLTYGGYIMYHASRRAFPNVKTTLEGCRKLNNTNCTNDGFAPFNGSNSVTVLSIMDTLWAISYAVCMFISGHIAERTSLRGFLGCGLIGSGFVSCIFGMSKYFNVHYVYFFYSLQLLGGLFQSFGWPSIMAIMGNWFGKGKHGSLMGIWNSHSYIGNILGLVISSYFADKNWALSFIVPGLMCIFAGIILILFLIESPSHIGFSFSSNDGKDCNEIPLNDKDKLEEFSPEKKNLIENGFPKSEESLGFIQTLFLPGVVEYSLSLFFSKLVTYTFLFWLPYYISSVGIKDKNLSNSSAGNFALLFDIGAIFGCFFIGLANDLSKNKSAIICVVCQALSVISLFLYYLYGASSYTTCISLLLITGFFTCAPSSLIMTSVTTSLGSNPKLGSKKAKATTAAIIDGTGSFGSVFGPFIVKYISQYEMKYLMIAMMASVILSAIFLIRQFVNEMHQCQKSNYSKYHKIEYCHIPDECNGDVVQEC